MWRPEDTDLYEGQYDVKAGRWPKKYNECVLVLTPDGSRSDVATNLRLQVFFLMEAHNQSKKQKNMEFH